MFSTQTDLLKDYTSNCEAGNGYADISFKNSENNIAVIIEITHSQVETNLVAKANEALDQILSNHYYQLYKSNDLISNILCYGISFKKKSCALAFKEITK